MRISTFLPKANRPQRDLEKRKGGGGGGGGAGGGHGGGRAGGSGRGSSSHAKPVPLAGGTAGGKTSATSYGKGGGTPAPIPAGQPFAGRIQGGGTRNDVYGTSTYGSGYPGLASQRGVAGAGFPFFFWPLVWGFTAGLAVGSYLDAAPEYGDPANTTRPGGALATAAFQSASSSFSDPNAPGTVLRLVADSSTTTSLIESVAQNCTSLLRSSANSPSTISPSPFNPEPNATNAIKPEQAIQYYRASSVVLTLDGYNNTAALSDDASAPPVPLPDWVDKPLLDCVNLTIGEAVPLIDGAFRTDHPAGGMMLLWVGGLILALAGVL